MSSQVDSANNKLINGNHGEIIYSDEAVREILNFLGIPSVQPAERLAVPEVQSERVVNISVDQSVKMQLTDPKKKVAESTDDIIVSFNPEVGIYRLRIIPQESKISYLSLTQISDKSVENRMFRVNFSKNRPVDYLLIYNPLSLSVPKLIQI